MGKGNFQKRKKKPEAGGRDRMRGTLHGLEKGGPMYLWKLRKANKVY